MTYGIGLTPGLLPAFKLAPTVKPSRLATTVKLDPSKVGIATRGGVPLALREAATAKIREVRLGRPVSPFKRPAYCEAHKEDRYRAAPSLIPAGSVVVVTGQITQIVDARQGAEWARAAMANALYIVGARRAYQNIAQPAKIGTSDEPRIIPFDSGFEMSADGRFKIGWIAAYAAAPVKRTALLGIMRRMGTLANAKVLGRTEQWLSVPYVITNPLDFGASGFERRLSTGQAVAPAMRPGDAYPAGVLPDWMPPQVVREKGAEGSVSAGARPFDPSGATRLAFTWTPTGSLAERPFWALAHLQRRVRDENWMQFDGEFAERAPNGKLHIGTIVSVSPAKLHEKNRSHLMAKMSEWARELNGINAADLRAKAAEAAQRVQEAHGVRVPAAHISATAAPWGMITIVPSSKSCYRSGGRADACGVAKEWQNLQRDDAGVLRNQAWGWMAMINRQPLPRAAPGRMTGERAVPYGPLDQTLTALANLPPYLQVPSRTRLVVVALKAENVLADFTVIMQAMLGGLAKASSFARAVLKEAQASKFRLNEGLQVAAGAPALRDTLLARARGYLQPDPNMNEAAQFFAEAKSAVATLVAKLRGALSLATSRVWAQPQQAHSMILETLQQGVAEMQRQTAHAPVKIQERVTCLYLEKAEQQLGPMTASLEADLRELPALSQQLAQVGPGALAVLEQLLVDLADIETQVGIPWYMKRGPLNLPVYGWLAVGGAAVVGAGAWAVSKKKKRRANAKGK